MNFITIMRKGHRHKHSFYRAAGLFVFMIFALSNSYATVSLNIHNTGCQDMKVYWNDFYGNEQYYTTVSPNDDWNVTTFAGHEWVYRTLSGSYLGNYICGSSYNQDDYFDSGACGGSGNCASTPSSISGFIYMGEYNGSKYFCSDDNNNSWADAISEVAAHGGHLAVINDAGENEFLKNNIIADFAWIGYTDEDHEGDFDWVNDEPDDYTNWNSGEPNNQGSSSGYADYTVIRKSDGKWFDRNGGDYYEYVMEIPCSSIPNGSCTNRTTDGLLALYTFEEGSGSSTHDQASFGNPLDLHFDHPNDVSWESDCGISIDNHTLISSGGNASKISNRIKTTNEITLEAWIQPENLHQDGPARIVTISHGTSDRNITLGQQDNKIEVRYRTSTTSHNGLAGATPNPSITTDLLHVVYTKNSSGTEKIYFNGNEVYAGTRGGNSNNWDSGYSLFLGNESSNNRAWLGKIFLVAFYDRDLSSAEIQDNYNAGECCDNLPPSPACVGSDFLWEGSERLIFSSNTSQTFTLPASFADVSSIDVSEVFTSDSYSGRQNVVQDNEQVRLIFRKNGQTTGQSDFTEDLPDLVQTGTWVGSLGTVIINGGADELIVAHVGDPDFGIGITNSPNSLDIRRICLSIPPCATAGGDTDGDGTCDNDDCAPNDPTLPAAPGTACNDGNPNTVNDEIQADGCTCEGVFDPCAANGGDTDGDGTCDNDDCAPNDPTLPAAPGTACNDGNPNTVNDEIQADGCTCEGVFDPCAANGGDTDGDGTCDNDDCAPNDPTLPAAPGTACNDGNPNTVNDEIQADGCTCEGVFDPCAANGGDTDGDGTCDNDDCAPNDPTLPSAPGTACNDGNPNTVNDEIQADGCTCEGVFDPCAANGGDTDGDGTCDNDDCAPNDPTLPAAPGTACNDGNPNTVNDEIQADGCSCEGDPIPPVCDNVTFGGTIGFGSGCNPTTTVCNSAAPLIENCATPTGGSGAFEIVWLKATNNPNCVPPSTTVGNLQNDPFWSLVVGETGLTLDPGTVTEKTCYLRCTRRAGCTTYIESNIISVDIDPSCGGGGDPDCADISITAGAGSITVSGLDGAPISSLQIFNSSWGQEFSCFANCGATETVNVPAGDYYVYAKYYTAGYGLICQIDETVTVGGGGGGPCAGQGGDSDGDGVCDNDDCQPNNANFPATPGTACNDGNPNTTNDQVTADGCGCEGTPTTNPCAGQGGDSDGDGVCDNDDCQPNNANFPATPGTACNDGNPNTNNDQVTADGCGCEGTPVGGGGDPDCADISITAGAGSITVSGLDGAPISSLQIFNSSWGQEFSCFANCGATETVNVPAGDYYVYAKYYTAGYGLICQIDETVTVGGGGGGPCAGQGGDSDGDGVCDNDDCQPNNANFPATPGTACNDGNPNTTNDQVTADGCGCEGTPTTNPCAGQGGDSDGDGVCDNDDCQPNNANFPATPGTACNDGNPNTNNDQVTADGCGCEGTPVGGGGDPDCADISITAGAGSITVSGLDGAPISSLQIFNSSWGQEFSCFANCGATETVNVPAGDYYVYAKYYTAGYGLICQIDETVTVGGGGGGPCAGQGGDSDGDGVCDNDDCQPNNANFPATPGTACNDGNPNTTNDQVTADGCGCAGTPIQTGGCTPETLAAWSLDACASCTSGSNADWTELTSSVAGVSGCVSVNASDITPVNSGSTHSCTPGQSGTAMCVGSDIEFEFEVTMNGNDGALTGISFYEQAPDTYVWDSPNNNCGAPVTGTNNPPSKFRLKVYRNGTLVYNTNNNTQSTWNLRNFDFSGDPDFAVDGNTVFRFVIKPNTPLGTGSVKAWDIDEISVFGCCGGNAGPCAGQGGDSDGDGVCDNDDCQPNNANFPATPGTACDDGNADTENDQVTADGCGCEGTTVGPEVCETRTASNSEADCGTGTDYGFFANNLVSGISEGSRYTIQNAVFEEFNDGTASFTARAVSVNDSSVKFDIEATLSGRTLTAPSGSPKNSSCYDINTDDWYYYTALDGTLTGLNAVAGGVIEISLLDDIAFQVGTGANLNDENEFGGSSWLDYHIVSEPNDHDLSFDDHVQMDFNIRLTGEGGDPCSTTGGGGGGTGVGGTGDCAGIQINTSPGQITVSGLDGAPVSSLQVFASDWTMVYFTCFGDCNATETVDLSPGSYIVLAKYYDAGWQPICEVNETVTVNSFLLGNAAFNFAAAKHQEHSELVWTHNGGENVLDYTLERSLDGTDFEPVFTYASKGVNGNETYQAYDFEPAYGDNFYRVRLDLVDGRVEYSQLEVLNFPDLLHVLLFPNPADQFVKANLEDIVGFEEVTITIFNNLGVAMKQFELDKVHSKYYQMDIRDLREGHYVVWFDIPGRRSLAKKLVVGKL